MKVHIVCPAPAGSTKGNRVTAQRWRTLLQELGHKVVIADGWRGERCDVLLALHARKSHAAVRAYRRQHPGAPVVVALTGTDVYRDLARSRRARESLQWATRLIALHDAIYEALPVEVHAKVSVILQSKRPLLPRPARSAEGVDLCVLGHLRHEKDPLRAALALRRKPHLKNVRLVQAGAALTPRYACWARAAMRRDPRYRWVGELPRARALRLLASSHLLVVSSRMEGGANVVSEAIVNRVPVLASHIPGNIGLLGPSYAGYYPAADTQALADLIERACRDRAFYRELTDAVCALAPRFTPARERQQLRILLDSLAE